MNMLREITDQKLLLFKEKMTSRSALPTIHLYRQDQIIFNGIKIKCKEKFELTCVDLYNYIQTRIPRTSRLHTAKSMAHKN